MWENFNIRRNIQNLCLIPNFEYLLLSYIMSSNDQGIDIRTFIKQKTANNNIIKRKVDSSQTIRHQPQSNIVCVDDGEFRPMVVQTQPTVPAQAHSCSFNIKPTRITGPNESQDDREFMNFFHVNKLINNKYDTKMNEAVESREPYPVISTEKLAELSLLYKLVNKPDFIRLLSTSYQGRTLVKNMDLCLDSLKNCIEMSSDSFRTQLNDLVGKYKS
jgi:hypothetical protein